MDGDARISVHPIIDVIQEERADAMLNFGDLHDGNDVPGGEREHELSSPKRRRTVVHEPGPVRPEGCESGLRAQQER